MTNTSVAIWWPYDHFSEPGKSNKWNGLWKNLKDTKFLSWSLQITDKKPEAKWVPSALVWAAHNSIDAFAAPVVDTINRVSARVMTVLKTFWNAAPIVWHPIQTVRENGFWKWTWKIVWTAWVWVAWWALDLASWSMQAPAKIYERLINANVQEATDILHMTSEKMRAAEKFWLKKLLPWAIDWIANWLKVVSKTIWYASWAYVLNWLARYANKWANIAQDYVKLKNVDTELARKVKNWDSTVLVA